MYILYIISLEGGTYAIYGLIIPGWCGEKLITAAVDRTNRTCITMQSEVRGMDIYFLKWWAIPPFIYPVGSRPILASLCFGRWLLLALAAAPLAAQARAMWAGVADSFHVGVLGMRNLEDSIIFHLPPSSGEIFTYLQQCSPPAQCLHRLGGFLLAE